MVLPEPRVTRDRLAVQLELPDLRVPWEQRERPDQPEHRVPLAPLDLREPGQLVPRVLRDSLGRASLDRLETPDQETSLDRRVTPDTPEPRPQSLDRLDHLLAQPEQRVPREQPDRLLVQPVPPGRSVSVSPALTE